MRAASILAADAGQQAIPCLLIGWNGIIDRTQDQALLLIGNACAHFVPARSVHQMESCMNIEKVLYRATATAAGGREGKAKSSDGVLELTLTIPKELGGDGSRGTNPEQLFAAGYSACFLSALKFVAGQEKQALPGAASSGRAVVSSDVRPCVSLFVRRHHARRAGIAMPSVGCAEPA